METNHINFWKTDTFFVACLKTHLCIVLNFTSCKLIQLHCITWIKILCWICFLDIRMGTFERICVWFSNDSCEPFESILWIKARWWCGVYWRVVFIQGRHLIELIQVRERLARGLALIIFRDLRGFINFFHVKCLPVEFMY